MPPRSSWLRVPDRRVVVSVLIAWYYMMPARISQAVLLDLRKRIFLHTQRLSLEFHESVHVGAHHLARRPSDLDSIRELLDDGPHKASCRGVLYMAFTAHRPACILDWQSGSCCSSSPASPLASW